VGEGGTRALYFHHPASREHDPHAVMPGHPENPMRLTMIEAAMDSVGWLGWERREAPAAGEEQLRLVHTAEHVASIRALAQAGGGAIDPDTYVAPGSYDAALHAAGAACEMTRCLLEGEAPFGFCGTRPAGHHAEAARAMGFCLFNNVAVAAELARRELGAERVLVLDWDVHHGNGTAEIFRARDDVLLASIHQHGIYPGTGPLDDVGSGAGAGYTLNLPVPGGSDERVWLSLLAHVIVPVAEAFEPQLVLVSAGFDAHRADPLAGCMLEDRSFAEMARLARELAARVAAPLGLVLEGGYEPAALAESVAATLAALTDERPPLPVAREEEITPRAATLLSRWWPLLATPV
jgi:acetoin utilization deacetylase AcuC-like enzyme